MKDQHIEERLTQHFKAAPQPRTEAVDATVRAVVAAAAQQERHTTTALIAPSWPALIAAQVRTTKGIVWITQAVVVALALIFIAGTNTLASTLAAFGSAGALLAAISVAGVVYNNNQTLTEVNYSCHFDYRQVTVARMMVYGMGDVVLFALLIVSGFTMLSSGFANAALCACVSFFSSGFLCMFVFTHYQGFHARTLSTVAITIIALCTAYIWYFNAHLFAMTPSGLWLAIAAVLGVGMVLFARKHLLKINQGFDTITYGTR